MGEWTIILEGLGSHNNNGNKDDADELFKKFIEELRVAGHTIEHATFSSYSGREKIV